MTFRRGRTRGVALVLASALLTLIAFLAAGLLNFSRVAARTGLSARMRSEAALAALSGLDYAAARLWQDWRPVWPKDPVTACDDWTAREDSVAVPFESVTRPSYSHVGPVPGSHPASGRLRGGAPSGNRFLLRVASQAGLICVNGGELGTLDADQDADDVANRDDPDYLEDSWVFPGFAGPNGVPDWRDADHQSNASLVNLLNNLGAVAGLALDPGATFAPPGPLNMNSLLNGSAPYAVSDLGRRVIAARPRGGYASIDDLRAVLGSDHAKVAPYLSVTGEIIFLQAASTKPAPLVSFPARIDFNAADPVVIEAALRYLSAGGKEVGIPLPPVQWLDKAFVRILPGEARRVAEGLVAARPLHGWRDFLQALVDMPDTVFEDDPFVAVAASNASWIPSKEGPFRRRLKEDLILAQMDVGFGWDFEEYRSSRRHLDVPREGPGFGCPVEGVAPTRDIRYRQEDLYGGYTTPFYNPNLGTSPGPLADRTTASFSLAPHRGSFRLECRGWGSGVGQADVPASFACGTDLFLGEELRLATQADFEQFMGWTGSRTAAPRRHPGGIVIDTASPEASRTGLQSWPLFPATTCRGGTWHDNAPPDGIRSYQAYYTDYGSGGFLGGPARAGCGWIELSARQWDDGTLLGAKGVFPFNEDGEPVLGLNEYNPSRTVDNLLDPIDNDARSPDLIGTVQGMVEGHLQCMSPMGPTDAKGNPNRIASLQMKWLETGVADPYGSRVNTPFARGAFDLDPALVKEANGPTGEVLEGTVGFWVYVPDNESSGIDVEANRMRLDIRYCGEKLLMGRPQPYFYDYLTVSCDPVSGIVRLASNPGIEAWTMPSSAYQAGGWRLVAITFHRDLAIQAGWGPDDTAAVVWVDAKPLNATSPFRVRFKPPAPPLDPDGVPPVYDEMKIDLSCWEPTLPVKGIDDLFVMAESLTFPVMRSLLLERRARQGSLRSSRFRFDPGHLPDGARVAGCAWDAFIPDGSRSEIRFTATSYDGAGGDAKAPEFPYAGIGPQAVPMPATSGQITREFDWGCAMSTASAATPILDEFRIFYTPGNALRRGAITTR